MRRCRTVSGPTAEVPQDFKTFYTGFRGAFPDITIRVDDMVAEGDMVAVRWTARATHAGDGIGVAPSGRPVEFPGMSFVRLRDGRVVESWNAFDRAALLQQVGVSLPFTSL